MRKTRITQKRKKWFRISK